MAFGSTDSGGEAAALLAEVDEEIRQQETEEKANCYVCVKKMRDDVKMESPAETVFFSAVMTALEAVRLSNNRGTRVTFIDGFMQPHFKAYNQKLAKLDVCRKEARVLKVTIWDPKDRSRGKPRFSVGRVYDMKKIHGVTFYHDVLQGNIQSVGPVNPGIIEEHGTFESAKRVRFANDEENQGVPTSGD